jgi:6-pyruvoyl-tetrahydropterin synthase
MVMDFGPLKQMLDEITAPLTRHPIDQFDFFKKNGSSTEIIAKYIFEKLKSMLPGHITLNQIILTEQPSCSVKYQPS